MSAKAPVLYSGMGHWPLVLAFLEAPQGTTNEGWGSDLAGFLFKLWVLEKNKSKKKPFIHTVTCFSHPVYSKGNGLTESIRQKQNTLRVLQDTLKLISLMAQPNPE